jgi:hypothetical protein
MADSVVSQTEVICPICRVGPDEPVNYCEDQSHEKCCKECISSYIQSTVNSAFMGSCPTIACPSSCHQSSGPGQKKKRRILRYKAWAPEVPADATRRYGELANSLLAFLCGGCHALKTLDLGFESDLPSGTSYQFLQQYLTTHGGTMDSLVTVIESYSSAAINVEEAYGSIIKDVFPNIVTLNDQMSWEIFSNILKIVADPERRANLHLRYLRDRPRIKTLCCSREHCFRCKVKDFHEGKSCMESSTELDHSVVNCPTCGIALAKGDGCNTITCVCGKQFSWSAEKENTDRCLQFLQSYPESTSSRCAHILCTEMSATGTVAQQAQAWQIRNRQEVTRCLQEWFRTKYWPCPSQSCVILQLDKLPGGIRQAVDIWKAHKPREVAKCAEQKRIATQTMFLTMYPDPAERPIAAHKIVNENRRTKNARTNPNADPQLMAGSAADWIEHNRDAYTQGVEAAELRMAKQFLFLYGRHKLHTTKPSCVTCPCAYEWCREISNDDLTYTNSNTSVTRVGSVSCYPAAFAKLPADHSMFRITIDVASRTSNWLTFGLARRGMATTSSDGVGRTANTWGVADDRSSGSLPVVSASGNNIGTFRKFTVGDVLSAEVDTAAGWLEVRLNDNECTQRFDIPPGTSEDYWFAMTFANDHQVTIQCDESAVQMPTEDKTIVGGQLNPEHTYMFNCFRKHVKSLLAEVEDVIPNRANPSPQEECASPLKTSPERWVELCGGKETASNYFETVHGELRSLSKVGRDYPWREPSVLPWLTWESVLWAASWYHENRKALKEIRDSELAYAFSLTHGADAPFIAALNLADYHTHRVDRADVLASLAFMRFYKDECNEWYDYDASSREPMVENVAKGCRCLPRHIKTCSVCR